MTLLSTHPKQVVAQVAACVGRGWPGQMQCLYDSSSQAGSDATSSYVRRKYYPHTHAFRSCEWYIRIRRQSDEESRRPRGRPWTWTTAAAIIVVPPPRPGRRRSSQIRPWTARGVGCFRRRGGARRRGGPSAWQPRCWQPPSSYSPSARGLRPTGCRRPPSSSTTRKVRSTTTLHKQYAYQEIANGPQRYLTHGYIARTIMKSRGVCIYIYIA
jgi:hypothetical protein